MISDKKLQEKIRWSPHKPKRHKAQIEILKCKAPFMVIAAGRGGGKSMICAYVGLRTFLQGLNEVRKGKKDEIKIWIVAPTYDLAKKVFNYIVVWLLRLDSNWASKITDRPFPQVKVSANAWIQCRSADNPASLLGERLDLLIGDEVARWKRSIWETELAATMAKSEKSRTFLISTFRGKNWFHDEWLRAKEEGGGFTFPSEVNPYLSKKRLERLKKVLPKDVWEQEYMAIPKESASSVFRGIKDIITPGCLGEPIAGHRYIMGLDLAKFKDFSVITIVDKFNHNVVCWDRFHKIPYTLQKERVINASRKYGARIIIDSLNIGASVGDDLRAEGLKIQDFKAVGSISPDWKKRGSKERLIERLSLFIADKNIHIPPIEILVDELEGFTYQMSSTGSLRYGAPEGYHDDCVMSLALAVWGLKGKTQKLNIRARQSISPRKRRFQYR